MSAALPNCPRCHNRRHVRLPDRTWVRCDCIVDVLRRHYIQPAIHKGEARYPADLDAKEPIPLTDSAHTGNWDNFRRMVWRSLMAYEPLSLTYDLVPLSRLADVVFAREATLANGYSSVQALAEPGLVILTIMPTTGVTKWTGVTIGELLEHRQAEGRPTWMFTSLTPNQMYTDVLSPSGPRVADALKPWFTTTAMTKW